MNELVSVYLYIHVMSVYLCMYVCMYTCRHKYYTRTLSIDKRSPVSTDSATPEGMPEHSWSGLTEKS